MNAADYYAGLERGQSTVPLRLDRLPATPWNPQLGAATAAAASLSTKSRTSEELLAYAAASERSLTRRCRLDDGAGASPEAGSLLWASCKEARWTLQQR
jgi:hypothetical protein